MHETEGRCFLHSFEPSEARCRNCGSEFCNECLVYAFGATKAPFCVGCALAASGVRSNAGRPPTVSRRELRRMEKERRRAERTKAADTGPRVEVAPGEWLPPQDPRQDDPFGWADDPDLGQRVPY